MSLNLTNLIISFLKENAGNRFTARQIAEHIVNSYPEECAAKMQRSEYINTNTKLIQQIAAEIGSKRPSLQKKEVTIKITEGRPRKYFYSENSDIIEVQEAENSIMSSAEINGNIKSELNLYPALLAFLRDEFGIYSKRIDEKRSSNRRGPNGNRWLYPDVVGMEDLSVDWYQEVKDCVRQYSGKRTKLWSFEVKRYINRSNIRECFFQTVSNSSWANFGYLVAEEIEGHDVLKEMRMLFSAHGIGLIRLDVENPSESEIIIPAKEKPEIDWDMVNRLVDENKDFLEYIKLVRQFYQIGEARLHDWAMSI